MSGVAEGIAADVAVSSFKALIRRAFENKIRITFPVNGGLLENEISNGENDSSYMMRRLLERLPSDHKIWLLTGDPIAGLDSITAPLNFLLPMAEKPVAYNYEPPQGVPQRTGKGVECQVRIRDARPLIGQLSLDKEGFVPLHHQTAATNFYDEDQIKNIYYPECERVMKEATGAERVVAFDHIVRNAAMSVKGNDIKIPAKRVHNDYTAWSAPQRVRDLMGEEAEELLKHRFAVNNLWRPIRGPVLDSPLTLCDAQSLEEQNLVASDLRYPDRTGETYSITYNPNQRYYYFPKMQADEAVLIRCYDSAPDGAHRFSAHTGFDDPTTPPGAPPRESLEVRMLVFFPPGS